MGDAGPFVTTALLQEDDGATVPVPVPHREVNVLVTGFGPFRSFTVNPSFLVATGLARNLEPEDPITASVLKQYCLESEDSLSHNCNETPYKINVHVYPSAIRVAYDAVGEIVPPLVSDPSTSSNTTTDAPTPPSSPEFEKPPNGFDYILHIGLAAGRDNYTLETIAHRDHYKLKDVDGHDGSKSETHFKDSRLPEVLDVSWHKEDVLGRWQSLVRHREDEFERAEMIQAGWRDDSNLTLVETARLRSQVFLGKGKRAVVKLSRDAGRYLCEFIFFTGLGTRWKEARDITNNNLNEGEGRINDDSDDEEHRRIRERVGKVAFLHVPGGTGKYDIARGVRVAESAVLALVSSWEDGYRNLEVQARQASGGENNNTTSSTTSHTNSYESQETGDRWWTPRSHIRRV